MVEPTPAEAPQFHDSKAVRAKVDNMTQHAVKSIGLSIHTGSSGGAPISGAPSGGTTPLRMSSAGAGLLSGACPTPASCSTPKGRFAVYDLVESAAPKTFHEAAEQGNTGMIVKMIERTIDIDINQRDRLARTALHWASENGHMETAQTLVDFGADIKILECNGRTAVHLAARSGNVAMLRLLLEPLSPRERLELVNQPDNNSITPTFLAVQRGEEAQEAFEYLLANGAHYNENSTGFSAAAHDAAH